jgi:hypothetical protein
MPREVLVKWLETLGERLRLARRITAVVGLVLLLYFFGTWLWCYVGWSSRQLKSWRVVGMDSSSWWSSDQAAE